MEQLLYWNDKYKIDLVHLETKDTDLNIDFENINQSFNSTSSSKENNEQKNDDNSSMQKIYIYFQNESVCKLNEIYFSKCKKFEE